MSAERIWHEVECGPYAADLALWEELASEAAGPVLELGAGCGRVALHLARCDHQVVGLELELAFLDALGEVGAGGDARDFDLDAEFGLILAPMQLLQLFADATERRACLGCVSRHLARGGLAAFAIVESVPAPVSAPPPLPDTREIDGWVYSSLPIEAAATGGAIRVRRLRQTVSPDGELREQLDEVVLRQIDAQTLEGEGRTVGLRPAGRRQVPPTEAHVGSTVVLMGRKD